MMFRLAVAVSGPRSFSRYRSCATIMSTPRTDAATDQSPLWRWRHPFRRIESDQKDNSIDSDSMPDKGKLPEDDGDNKYASLIKEKEVLLEQKETEIKEIKDKYLRSLAEIENTRQRMNKLVEDGKKFGIQSFSKDIIEVADILEKAMECVPETELSNDVNPHLSTLFQGLNMTKNELQKVFVRNGLERINPLGEIFDPAVHEALFQVPGDKPGTVGVVSKVGYLLNGRTVRPALVGVVKEK